MPKQVVEIIMPQLAESLVSATIDRWLKQVGEEVDMYEPLCDLITDKVNAELPSTAKGVLVKILVGPGETVDVGTPVCLIETEAAAGASAANEPADKPLAAAAAGSGTESRAGDARPAAPLLPAAFDPNAPMRHRYSPAVQKLAAEHSIDLSRVVGTGMGGRITRKDVLDAAQNGTAGFAAAVSAPAPEAPKKEAPKSPMDPRVPVRSTGLHLTEEPRIPTIEVEGHELPGRGEYFIDVTPVRNSIATKMRQSVSEIPHGWMMIEVDVTNLVLLRNSLKDEFKKREGINLTYMPFLCKATVNAIKDYPIMNSVWATDKIIVKRDINLSLAVGTEDSVITPVIRNADQKNIAGLAHEINDLARRTRDGKIKLNDLQGGTFTVNNTGAFGSILSQPIINYPQAAIMTFESIVKKPVVINDMIGVRSMVNICLSLDHRILDGVICGRFLQRVKENLESYNMDTKVY
ncbi:dihydrolipoamide acetyltransferase family protein [Cohnella thailandensis]|uniref:Dihydrolipoamide acetyltransferase component of pyruvate dehydrogenase complex n=1 Tax=Cohnella thailandensis TaxID=557557 RepID=A0A841T0V6_9BACL|nr:dihydrolipoamide acetyltransferase family protein [Cohnella thailandensis]MBB6635497.1 2-oxo acid dehydrogenase subunit E2 [Cohnella thailandensis]MBP1974877.1 2-oxoisovalerate dehydrogenase E2 component (dihydrolipoyl transacylase) [Cohnella thailandensis]